MAHRKKSVATFIGTTAIIAGMFFGSANAADDEGVPIEVENFVLETGQKVISILQQGDDHGLVLKQLFRASFDYKLMGRFALGPFWKKADPKQIIEYNELFAAYVPNGYVGRLSNYRDADFALVRSRSLNGSDTVVTTRLAPKNGDALALDWRVRENAHKYKVIDLIVGRVSYLKTLRQEFTSIAARIGIEGLLNLLRQHAVSNGAAVKESSRSLAARRSIAAAIVSTTTSAYRRNSTRRSPPSTASNA